jgi:hypothetical protein
MRRSSLLVLTVALPTVLALGACSDGSSPSAAPSSSPEGPTPSSSGQESDEADPVEEGEDEAEDTWADVTDPATMRAPLGTVEGVEDVRVWEGSRFRKNPSAVVVAVPAEGGGFQTLTLGSSTVLAEETSEAEARYWSRNSGLLAAPAKILQPVVVDGLELQHARGRNEVEVVDGYLYADGEISYQIIFTTPLAYTDAQRDEAIGQVMATLEFE